MKYFTLVFCLLSTAAFGQQQTVDQRVANQIGALVIQNTSLAVQVEQMQTMLKAAQDRIRALEDKYESKKDDPK